MADNLVQSRTNLVRAGTRSVVTRLDTGRQDPSGTGGTIEQWVSQPRARACSALATSSRPSQRELRPSPAISPALSESRRRWGASSPRCSGSWSRARARRRSVGCCSSRPSDSVSTLATGSRSRGAVESAPAPRTRCSARSLRSRPRAGGFGTLCPGGATETSTRSPSLRPGSPSRSRRRRGRTTLAISLACANRRHGCPDGGEGGPATAPLP